MSTILTWIVNAILNWLLSKAVAAVSQYEAQVADDKKRGEINDANTKAYEDAVDRQARIDAALVLLNRTSP